MPKYDFAGQAAVITGGAKGIGLAIAQRLIADGASVSLWDLDSERLVKAAESLAGKVHTHDAVAPPAKRSHDGHQGPVAADGGAVVPRVPVPISPEYSRLMALMVRLARLGTTRVSMLSMTALRVVPQRQWRMRT